MNDTEEKRLISLRKQGLGYKKIAQAIGVSVNTVKTYCRRHAIGKDTIADERLKDHRCLECGKKVLQVKGKREKKFCSDECRMKWWNSHRGLVHHRNLHEIECPGCHKLFTVAGKSRRKYCCHECYILDRFGGTA